MRVVLAPAARRDISQISDYVSQEGGLHGRAFMRKMRLKIRQLGQLPDTSSLEPRFARLDLRRLVFSSYIIYHRVTNGRIVVVRVLHAARDADWIILNSVEPDR